MRSRAFFSVSSRSLIGAPLQISSRPQPRTLIEGSREFALPEQDRRLIVIVTHLGIAGGRERNDGEFAQCQSLRRSQRATFRLANYWRVGLQLSALAGVECLYEVGCFAGHEGSF